MDKSRFLKKLTFCVVLSVLIGSACENKPSLGQFQFPLEIGNSWKYARHFTPHNWESNGGEYQHIDSAFDTSYTEVISLDTLTYSAPTYKLETAWYCNGDTGHSTDYIGNNDSGLYRYAYSGGSWVGPPKINSIDHGKIIFKGKTYSDYNQLLNNMLFSAKGCIVTGAAFNQTDETHPIKALIYPLIVGKQWVYRDADLGDPWDMDKKIMKIDEISVPAGKFDCFKIKWFWDIDDDGQWDTDINGYDYLTPNGYLKREFNFEGVIRTSETGDTLGTYDSKDIYELIHYQIHK